MFNSKLLINFAMNFKTAYSTRINVQEAVQELKSQLMNFDTNLILFFASPVYDPATLSAEMHRTFQEATTAGCTTSGEIVSGLMLDQSIVAMAFHRSVTSNFKTEVVTNIRTDEHAVAKAFTSFEQHFGTSMDTMHPSEHVGIVLIDGVSGCEEVINEKIGDATNVTFVGGSPGDDLQFKATYVYANGKAYEEAALLLLMKPTVPFTVLKTQSFRESGQVLTVTETNEATREVLSFNGQPASAAYAEALGVAEEVLSDHVFKNPLGLVLAKNEPFVRSPRVIEDDRIFFYCHVKKGMDLSVLHSTDIVEDTKQALEDKIQEMNQVSGIINFNCILRTLDLKEQNRTQEYANLFATIPTVGFSTYGESYIGHINQTATMLLFG